MERNQAGRGWISKATAFSLSSLLAGMTSGAILGAAGSVVPFDLRVMVVSLLGIAAIVLGGLELLGGRRVRLPQIGRATPQTWLEAGPLRWATRNGLTLGFGATSRIGFWLWYAVPLAALLAGNPILGAAIYGTYGLIRGLGPWAIILSARVAEADVQEWLIEHNKTAHVLAAGQLVLVGVAVAVSFGL